MSYLDQLNSFTGDLNLQHEQMTASLSNLAENLQGQFNDEFNKTIEQMELAGGAVGTAGVGLSGIHKSFKGFKKWKDARAEKLSKAQETTRGGEKIDPDLRITESEAKSITGGDKEETLEELKARVAENNRVGKVETEQKFVNEPEAQAQGASAEGAEAESTSVEDLKALREANPPPDPAPSLPTTGAEAEEGAVNQFLGGIEGGGDISADVARSANVIRRPQGEDLGYRRPPDFEAEEGETGFNAFEPLDNQPPSVRGVPEGDFMETSSFSNADQTIGGSTKLNGYNFESEGIFDKPHHSGATDLDQALGGAEETAELPTRPNPEFIRETRTTLQLRPPENTRMRSGTRSGDLLEGDGDNVRVGASRNTNVSEIETSFDRPNPKYREPTLEGEGRLQPTTYTDSTIQDSTTHIVSDPATNSISEPYITQPPDDLTRQPFNTQGGKGAEGRGADTNIQRQVGETGDYKGGTVAEAEAEPTGGLPKSGGEPVSQPQSITQNIGDIPPDRQPLDSRGLGTNVGEVSAGGEEGVGVGRTVATGAEVGAETGAEVGAEVGSGMLAELGAMGTAEIALGSLGPVAEVVGAGFMIAGLVHDLQDKPAEVAKTIAGGVSGKVGFDPSSVGGGGSAGMGII